MRARRVHRLSGCLWTLALLALTLPPPAAAWTVQKLEIPEIPSPGTDEHSYFLKRLTADGRVAVTATLAGLQVYRVDADGRWSVCGRIGSMPEGPGLPKIQGVGGEVPLMLKRMELFGDTLALVNSRARSATDPNLIDHIDLLTLRGCDLSWDKTLAWERAWGGYLGYSLGMHGDRLAVGDPLAGEVDVFRRTSTGWHERSTHLTIASRWWDSARTTQGFSRFIATYGDGVAFEDGPSGEPLVAVAASADPDSLPSSGAILVYDLSDPSIGEDVPVRETLYAPDSRPGDHFGVDVEIQGRLFATGRRIFERGSDGRLRETAGSPLRPAAVRRNRTPGPMAWSDRMVVIGAPLDENVQRPPEWRLENPGQIFVFVRASDGEAWHEIPPPPTPAGATGDFGKWVVLAEGGFFVGDERGGEIYFFAGP